MAISVTKLTPATGPAGAVTGVAAVGTNLTIVTKVEMYLQSVGPSGAVGCPFTLVDATNLTFTTMLSMVAGAAVVRVTASDFSSSTIGFTFTLPAPVVTSMTPSSGPAGTSVTLAGQWLDSVTSVSVGGVPTTIGAQTPTSLSFVTPDGLIGPQVVVVTNATGSAQSTFTYPTPPTPPTPKVCIRRAWLTLGALTMPLEDPDVGYYCTELDLGFPAPREVVDNRPDMDGVTDRTMVSSSRVVSANITATGAPVDAIATQFSPFMVASVRPVLHYVLDRGASSGERTLTVRGSNYTCPISGSATRQIQLQWVAADPVAYDVTLESSTAWAGSATIAGRTYNLTFPRTYPSGGGSATTGQLLSAGDVPFRPVFRIYGPITAPLLKILQGAASVEVFTFAGSFTIAANHYVDIDSAKHTIIDDTGASQYSQVLWANSNWAALLPQTQYAMTLAGGTTSGVTQVQATWQDGYLT